MQNDKELITVTRGTMAEIGQACSDLVAAERTEAGVYAEIRAERERQDAQWGGPPHDDKHSLFDWREYRIKFENRAVFDRERRRDALVKIAALAVAEIESLDRLTTTGAEHA